MATRKTYLQMLEDIELLQRRAEDQRRREVEIVIGRIREAMAFWGITEQDIGFHRKPEKSSPPAPAAPAPAKKKRKSRYTERPLAGPQKRPERGRGT